MKVNRLLKTMLVFFLGSALSKIISFLLLPLYTSKISPAQFGSYDLVLSFINLVAPLAFLQVWDGMFRIAFDFKEKHQKQAVISNALAFSGIGVLLYLLSFSILQFFFEFEYFSLVLIYGLVFGVNYVYTFSARAHLSNKLFVFSGVVCTLVTAILNIVLIVYFGWDVKSIYFSAIIGILCQMLIIEIFIGVFRKFSFKDVKKELIKQMLVFSLPLCISTISYWLLSGYTKVLITHFVGEEGNGLYAVANKFSVFITFLVTVVQYAWNETAYLISKEDAQDKKKGYQTSFNAILFGVTLGSALVCIFSKIIFPFMVDNAYNNAKELVPIAIVGVLFNSLASFIGTFFMAEKKNKFILYSMLIAAAFNVCIGYFATKYYSVFGAVTALSVGFIILAVIRVALAVVVFKLKINLLYTLLSLLALIGSIVVYYLIQSTIILTLILVVSIVLISLCLKNKIKEFIVNLKSNKTNS